MNADGKAAVPVGFSILHKAPIETGVVVGHDVQIPVDWHAVEDAQTEVTPDCC